MFQDLCIEKAAETTLSLEAPQCKFCTGMCCGRIATALIGIVKLDNKIYDMCYDEEFYSSL